MALDPPDSEAGDDSDADSLHGGKRDTEPITRAFLKTTIIQALHPLLKEMKHIRADLRHLGGRVDAVEEQQASMLTFNMAVQQKFSESQRQLNVAFNQIEDLENRNRRNNLHMPQVAADIFSTVLGQQRASSIVIERIHRALRPNDPPSDVIKLLNFADTADILRQAREQGEVLLDSNAVQIYQGLSPTTLAKRRTMKPLLEHLRAHNLVYRWT
ncbi:uncharacterized protein LOC120986869 [Bufo bufo]|uniref:uncharacterized protein LOC120986869 n=1 Tax=Bufo bufo TaxID=8384 RepID=UPI001ABEAED0|nr:uncharacterized protein LOC120986869 [Bufo bufo]